MRLIALYFAAIALVLCSCEPRASIKGTVNQNGSINTTQEPTANTEQISTSNTDTTVTPKAPYSKLTDAACVDPDLSMVAVGVSMTLCDGSSAQGTMALPHASDLRSGVSVAGISGTLKSRCRNTINSTIANSDTTVEIGVTTGTAKDLWDSIDDFNNNASSAPADVVSGWPNDSKCDRSNWSDLTADGNCNAAADDCKLMDNMTKLIWSEINPVTGQAPAGMDVGNDNYWVNAVNDCSNLVYGGRSDWRLPTQKELMQAYIHGMSDVLKQFGANFYVDISEPLWSSTLYSAAATSAWRVDMSTGATAFGAAAYLRNYMCVTE